MSRLNKRIDDLERQNPDAAKAPTVQRVIIGQNEAGEWVEKKIIEKEADK
jgi:hypothetical protein